MRLCWATLEKDLQRETKMSERPVLEPFVLHSRYSHTRINWLLFWFKGLNSLVSWSSAPQQCQHSLTITLSKSLISASANPFSPGPTWCNSSQVTKTVQIPTGHKNQYNFNSSHTNPTIPKHFLWTDCFQDKHFSGCCAEKQLPVCRTLHSTPG